MQPMESGLIERKAAQIQSDAAAIRPHRTLRDYFSALRDQLDLSDRERVLARVDLLISRHRTLFPDILGIAACKIHVASQTLHLALRDHSQGAQLTEIARDIGTPRCPMAARGCPLIDATCPCRGQKQK
ncbi:MAG: hypothetical protein ACPGO3_02550 [Magnetospiraceae bacterium]